MNQPISDISYRPLLGRLRFILVNTSSPGNVGAAARAIKTMGFTDLVLVKPRFDNVRQEDEAIAFASGAQDILANARVVDTIEEALQGCNFAAAVSARLREFSPPVITPRDLAGKIAGDGALSAALVFGNERFGLPNEIVQQCNMLINIPSNPDYASLNLAQAVQVLAYECRMAGLALQDNPTMTTQTDIGFEGKTASMAEVDGMFAHLQQALVAIGYLDPDKPKKLMPRLRRLFARTQLEAEEVNILRGIASQMLAPKQGKKHE